MSVPALVKLVQVQGDDGLSFREIVDSLPADPASLFVLVLVMGFLGLIVYFGVIRGGEDGNDGKAPPTSSGPPTAKARGAGRDQEERTSGSE